MNKSGRKNSKIREKESKSKLTESNKNKILFLIGKNFLFHRDDIVDKERLNFDIEVSSSLIDRFFKKTITILKI